jgi:hypothetical protein
MNLFKKILEIIDERTQHKSELHRASQAHQDARGTPRSTVTRRQLNRARLTHIIGMNVKEKADLKKAKEKENQPKDKKVK